MANEQKAIIEELNSLIDNLKNSEDVSPEEIEDAIGEITDEIAQNEAKKKEKVSQDILMKLDALIGAVSDNKDLAQQVSQKTIEAIKSVKIESPQVKVAAPIVTPPKIQVNVPQIKIPPINVPQTEVKFPSEMAIKKPSWFGLSPVTSILEPIKKAIVDFSLPRSATDAIAVRLSDGEKFYRAMGGVAQTISGMFPFKKAYLDDRAALGDDDGVVQTNSIGGSTSAIQTDGTQKTQIVDAGGEVATLTGGKLDVNATLDTTGLATSAKQDTGNTSLSSIDGKITAVNTGAVVVSSSVLPTGAATSAKQDSQITLQTQLESLVETLQELVQRLAPLAGAMSNPAALRVAPVSSVSTAVTGPITSAQSIAEKAVAGVLYPEKVAITNLTAIQSNINNAVAA